MTVQPNYHWQFSEKRGAEIVDTVSSVKAKLSNTTWLGHGRIGNAIRIDGRVKNARVVFDNKVARFGTSDFTIAFGMKAQGTYGEKRLHVIGNRSTSGHGNFFSLRMKNQGELTFEVDENTRGKNYASLNSKRPLKDAKWHHIAIVRQGRSLKLYIDGELSDQGTSKTGVANIVTDAPLLLGSRGLKTPIAQYEDLRIYHTALSTADVKALVTPVNRPLRAGEIELVAADNAAVLLTQNVDNLSHFSTSFKQLRIANNTGVTLYQQSDFQGTAQKCYAELPDIRLSRLKTFPKSIRIWSTVGEPFTGKWIIKAPNGQFLSLGQNRLTTVPPKGANKLFKFHYNLQQSKLQLIPGFDQENAFFTLSSVEAPTYLFVDESDGREFSLINQANEWLELVENNTFSWTRQKDSRAIFVRVVKVADNEGQVGELASGEVALYEHVAYYGKTWILSDSAKHVSGEYRHLSQFQGLQDQTSSIRLGPDTGATLFKHSTFRADDDTREDDIEDIIKNVPDLRESQVGNDALSSIKIFKTLEPEDVFSSYTTKLSQDYHMVGDTLEEFSSYRTTLRFQPGAGAIEVAATDLTQIEVEGTTYDIDEERSVTLSPNQLNLIMITSEANGLDTPGLKIRTSEMAPNEQVVIFPNQAAHQQIAELEDGALWNAKDAKGNLIVDRQAHSKAEVASAQNTIKRVMATVAYNNEAPTAAENKRVQSSNRAVSSATIDKPWELTLGATGGNPLPRPDDGQQFIVVNPPIEERQVSSDEWQQLLDQSTSAEDDSEPAASSPVAKSLVTSKVFGARRLGRRIGRRFKKAIKKATSVVIGKVKDVVHVIVKTATEVIDFVVDTVEKVAEFVEAVVEKVVKGIKQFIEFLQFLFGWDDILETQRYLVNVFNSGLNSATQLAENAKPAVSAFVDSLQNSVEDGMNALVKDLGGEPSEVKDSGFELPEAFEWFLSKILGGSKQKDADLAVDLGGNPSDDSALGNFFSHFLEALEDAIGAGLRVSEGLLESLQELISNPRQPQFALIAIIEALRDAIIQSLDAAENVTLGLLDIVGEAVKQLQSLLNAEIKIPFISELFKLIGAGKLTILNMSSLLLAIPVTVISKIATKEKPFTGGALPLDLSTSAQAKRLVTTAQKTGDDDETAADDGNGDETANDLRNERTLTLVAMAADTANHIINGILDLSNKPTPASTPEKADPISQGIEYTSLFLSSISFLASYPFDSEEDSKEAKREQILWDVRACALGADMAVAIIGGGRRMRRLNSGTAVAWSLYSFVDMILFSMYLAAVEEDNKAIKSADIIAEVFAWLPNFTCMLRAISFPEPAATIVHVGHASTNAIAAISTLATGSVLVREANKAIQAADASA